jgi:hypothetical protein
LVGFLFISLGEVKENNRGRREDVPPTTTISLFLKETSGIERHKYQTA